MKKITKISLGVVIIGALLYFCVNLVMFLLVRQGGQEIEVPDLTGINLQEAYDKLTTLNLFLVKDGEQYNVSIPTGAIISQSPLPGTKVKTGRKIRIIVSRGSEKIVIPNVLGKSWREAEIILRQTGLIIEETLRLNTDKEMDSVVMQDPEAGASVEKGSNINLIVSNGPIAAGSLMPNLLSRSLDQVDRIIKMMGLRTDKIITEVNDNINSGTVLRQMPDPDTPINKDTVVNLVISVKTGEDLSSATIKILHYEIAQGLLEKRVRIVVMDEEGEREVYNKMQAPGSKIDIALNIKGKASAKIYVNEILAEDRQLND